MARSTYRWVAVLGGLALHWSFVGLPPSHGEPTGPRVTGVVIGPDGTPVAGAIVAVASTTVTAPYGPGVPVPRGPVEATLATTGADGRFSMAAPPVAVTCAVAVETPAGAFYFAPRVAAVARVTARVAPGAPVTGRVIDTEERPVAGARVRARLVVEGYVVDRSTTTAADGTYRLDGLPTAAAGRDATGEIGAIEVEAKGHAHLTVALERPPLGGLERTLVVERGGRVVVRAVDGLTGAPVAGARVLLWSVEHMADTSEIRGGWPRGPLGAFWSPRAIAEATTRPDGQVSFEAVPCRGFHGVLPAHELYGRWSLHASGWSDAGFATITVESPPCDRSGSVHLLRLWPTAAVSGRVVDADGRAVSGVIVGIQSKDRPNQTPDGEPWYAESLFAMHGPPGTRAFLTGADGRFRWPQIPVQDNLGEPLELTWSSFHGSEISPSHDGSQPIRFKAGDDLDVGDLPLLAPPSDLVHLVRVRVVLPDGSPAAGAEVLRIGRDRGESAFVDRDGLAAWPMDKDDGLTVRLVAVAHGYASETKDVPVNPGIGPLSAASTLTLKLVEVRLEGRVRLTSGAAVPEAQISAIWKPAGGGRPVQARHGYAAQAWTTTSDDAGAFRLDGLPDGHWHLSVQGGLLHALRSSWPRRPSLEAVIPPETRTSIDLVFGSPDEERLGGLEVEVVDAESNRHPMRTSVHVWRRGFRRGSAWHGSSMVPSPGLHRLEGLPPGPVEVLVWSEDHVPVIVRAEVVEGQTVRLPPVKVASGVTLRGRVHPEDLRALGPSLRLYFNPGRSVLDAQGRYAEVDDEGSFEVRGLSPGPWFVVVRTATGSPLVLDSGPTLTIPDARTDGDWTPRLRRAGVVSIRPTPPTFPFSRTLDGEVPEAQQRRADGSRIEIVDAVGRRVAEQVGGFRHPFSATLQGVYLEPGRYTVRSQLPDGPWRELQVEVSLGSTLQFEFTEDGVVEPAGR